MENIKELDLLIEIRVQVNRDVSEIISLKVSYGQLTKNTLPLTHIESLLTVLQS